MRKGQRNLGGERGGEKTETEGEMQRIGKK